MARSYSHSTGPAARKGWRVLQEYSDQGKVIEASVSGYNKGGLLVTVKGVNAFVPLSQIVSERPRPSVT